MIAPSRRLIHWLVEPDRQEEILGDLEELNAHQAGHAWRDTLSVCARQFRYRASAARGVVVAALLAEAALFASPGATFRVVRATDAAGSFTLQLRGSRVLAASLDGRPVDRVRLIQTADRLVIRNGDGPRDLVIRLEPGGRLSWQGRASHAPAND